MPSRNSEPTKSTIVELPPEAVATLPTWVKASVVMVPLVTGAISGTVSGFGSGGQAAAEERVKAAQERAVLAEQVKRLQDDVRGLDDKLDRILERAANK